MSTEREVESSELTIVLIKPEAVDRGLVGEIVRRLEALSLRVASIHSVMMTLEKALEHYGPELAERRGPEVRRLVASSLAGRRVVLLLLQGESAVAKVRAAVGRDADPALCAFGTIRRDLSDDSLARAIAEGRVVRNLAHAADSIEAASKEISIWKDVLDDYISPPAG